MSTEQDLRKELKNIENEIEDLEKQRKDVEKLLVEKIKSSSTKFFKIVATPDKSSHSKHIVCFYSSLEKAQSILGNTKSSQDSDNNVTWDYTIGLASAEETANISLRDLNQVPSHFPYTGW